MHNSDFLKNYIQTHGISARVIKKEYTESTKDACGALRAIGIKLELKDMIKAIVAKAFLSDGQDNIPILILVSGEDRIDLNILRHILKIKRIEIPGPKEAGEISSFPRGGTPPIYTSGIAITVIENKLLSPARNLYGGGGDNEHIIEIHSDEMINCLKLDEKSKIIIASVSMSKKDR